MKFLITGGCGFLGSNLAAQLLKQKAELCIFDNLSRLGTEKNRDWLSSLGKYQFVHGDIRSAQDIERTVQNFKPNVVFHFTGQVAMTTSIENPRKDFETNALGTLNMLEAVRLHAPQAAVFFSSTNKVYGDLENLNYQETATRYALKEFPEGFDESLPLDFRSPYGCSKGSADQYILDYHRIFGLKTVVFRHSSIFGGRQFSTIDQGWVGWFVQQALQIKKNKNIEPFTISGNGKQVRDLLFASDLIQCYLKALENIDKIQGQVFNIGGGMKNSYSLLELFAFLEKELKIEMKFKEIPWRASDQKIFVAKTDKAARGFNWQPALSKEDGVRQMIDWVQSQ